MRSLTGFAALALALGATACREYTSSLAGLDSDPFLARGLPWSAGSSGPSSCTTNAAGSCTFGKTISNSFSSVTWSVGTLSVAGFTYDAAANVESNIVVPRP